jgi:serine/threonine protein kinase/tetratricopeptide (TPR) repeat protein
MIEQASQWKEHRQPAPLKRACETRACNFTSEQNNWSLVLLTGKRRVTERTAGSIMNLSQAEEIFHHALELGDANARAAYLTSACAGEPDLRAQVQQLLAAHEAPIGFLSAKPEATSKIATSVEALGSRIGRYKLLQKIGEGGMGVVYMAEQEEPVRRRVALKIIKLGMDTRSVVARFEAERQALAMMDHPNIARVLDGGATDTGRPYFVMELVQGVPITEFCDRNRLNTEARLRLFTEVCQAVQSAHQKGIIHRDLKPSNVLVTLHNSEPMPKVIDFGIAKATNQKLTEKTLFTQHAAMIGTPAYMSPEQAEMSSLDVDTRSDIYSLGVLLYELLTGSTPFPEKRLRGAGYGEIQRIILQEEPERPSTRLSTLGQQEKTAVAQNRGAQLSSLNHVMRGDLDCIVMKCLEKDRSRRYETANGLATDIQRHLSNEAVVARPPSAAYKIQKAWQRNKVAYTAAAAVAMTLLVGAILSYVQAQRARKAETLAQARLIEIQKERDATEQVSHFLQRVFQSPEPGRDGRHITVAELLDRSAQQVEKELQAPEQRARLQSTLASTYASLGLLSSAIPLREKARAYWLDHSGPDAPETLAESRFLTQQLTGAGRLQEALPLAEDVLARYRRLYGAENTNTVRAAYDYATVLEQLGRNKDALPIREKLLDLSRRIFGPEHDDTLRAINAMEVSYYYAGQKQRARALENELVTLAKKVKGPEHPMTLSYLANLGVDYENDGEDQKAIELLEPLLATMRRVSGPEHPETLFAIQTLAGAYDGAGRREEALKLRENVLDLTRRKVSPEHPIMVFRTRSLADSYQAAGRTNEALQLYQTALALGLKLFGSAHVQTALAAEHLALSCYQAGRFQDAIKAGQQAVESARAVLDSKAPWILYELRLLATFHRAAGDTEQTRRLLEEIISSPPDTRPTRDREVAIALRIRADMYTEAHQWREAREELAGLLDIKSFPDDSHLSLLALSSLNAYLQDDAGHEAACKFILTRFGATTNASTADRMAKACLLLPIQGDELRQAVALADRAVSLGARDPLLHWYLFARGLARYRTGDSQGAATAMEESLRAPDGENPYCAAPATLVLAMAQQRLGNATKARQALARVVEMIDQKLPALDSRISDDAWPEVLVTHTLLREARALIP